MLFCTNTVGITVNNTGLCEVCHRSIQYLLVEVRYCRTSTSGGAAVLHEHAGLRQLPAMLLQ